MSLPKIPAAREAVDVDGTFIEIRSLTRAEAMRFARMTDDGARGADLEIPVLAAATDTDPDETRAWYENTPTHVIDVVLEAIKRLSRLDEGAQKSGAESDSPGGR